jgi:hypothetical protein
VVVEVQVTIQNSCSRTKCDAAPVIEGPRELHPAAIVGKVELRERHLTACCGACEETSAGNADQVKVETRIRRLRVAQSPITAFQRLEPHRHDMRCMMGKKGYEDSDIELERDRTAQSREGLRV